MFVRQSTYDRLWGQYAALRGAHASLLKEWNHLVRRINSKGGEEFLQAAPSQLSEEELRKLLMLCHPDKHGGKLLAHEMTARLLELRKKG